jgi:cytochrome c peroxidase
MKLGQHTVNIRISRALLFSLLGLILVVFYQCKQTTTKGIFSTTSEEMLSNSDMEAEKILLGRKLFFDKNLSSDRTVSCATCHQPAMAFTDRKRVSEGVENQESLRNAPSLLNSKHLKTVMYDAHLKSLELQILVPIQEKSEMNMKMKDLIQRLREVEEYQKAAQRIFQRDFDSYVLTRSIAAFERTLVSNNSRFDDYYVHKRKNTLTAQEKKGWKLFSEKLYCTHCHPAPEFTTYQAENNGLSLDYKSDQGRFRVSGDSSEIGKFKIPSLRNSGLTYPYMHDGSLATMDEVIAHYQSGGKKYQNKHPIIKPFELTAEEKNQLKAFLFSLTDTSYMHQFR